MSHETREELVAERDRLREHVAYLEARYSEKLQRINTQLTEQYASLRNTVVAAGVQLQLDQTLYDKREQQLRKPTTTTIGSDGRYD